MLLRPATRGGGIKGYISDHWHGRQGLAWSFWVNLVLVCVLLFAFEGFAQKLFLPETHGALLLAIVLFLVLHGLLYVWQVVGVVRACDRYQSAYGSLSVVFGTYLGVAISLLLTFVSAFAIFQSALVAPQTYLLSLIWEQEREAKYRLEVGEDDRTLYLTGSIEGGLSKKLGALLRERPALSRLVLSSEGGNIYEARGVAKLLKARHISTHVSDACYSACTTIFIAGQRRTLGPHGRLGFHQYSLDADYQVPFADPASEEQIELAFYREQGVSEDFLARVFESASNALWFPSTEDLLTAGVVHQVVADDQAAP